MTVKELEELQLNDYSAHWELFTNSQDISDVMLGWRLTTQANIDAIGCLFVRWLQTELDQVWYCESNIPYHHKQVYQLK